MIINKIKDILIKNIKPYLIYLFGSSVKDTFREDSDIDIAFMSDTKYSDYEVFMIAQEIAGIFNRDIILKGIRERGSVYGN